MYRYTHFRPSFSYFKETFAYSAPIMPARIGSWVKEYASRFFIVGTLTLSSLGLYSFAIKIALIIKLAENAFKLTWTPKQVELYGVKNSEPIFARILDYYMIAYFLLCVFITALSPFAVIILATPAFYTATTMVGLLCAAYLWDGSMNILAAGNSWSRKTYYNSLGSIIAGLVAVGILWIGIGRWGLIVAPVALLVSSIVRSMIILWTAQLNHKIPYSYTNILVMIFSTLSFSLLSYLIFKDDSLTILLSSASVLFIGLLFFIVIFMVVFTSSQRRKVFKLVNNNPLTNKQKNDNWNI
jgi:O-antigen/teichoic acid export membrane protein